MNALNLTAPDGTTAFRFVKNADGVTWNHYEQRLCNDAQFLRKACLSLQEVTGLAHRLRAHGWR